MANFEKAPQQAPPNFIQNSPSLQQNYQQPQPMPQPQVMQAPVMTAPQPMQAPAPAQAKKKSHVGEIILIIFIFLIAGGAVAGAIYCYTQYDTLNREVLADRGVKVDKAKTEQKEQDEQNYERRSAKTTREFTGPSNFGALTFEYPKEWNVYIDDDSSTEPTYAAYFSPDYAKPINSANQGLEFKINSQNYDATVKNYTHNLISSTAYSANGLTGTIFRGKLDKKEDSKDGVAVVIKVNNYSATILTRDYETYGEEFDKIINSLKSANYE
jgi:type IV secretory pathway VirB10-like protein